MDRDLTTYCNCMEEIRRRIGLVQAVLASTITTGHEMFDIELVFIQLRKTLELIAFGSLTANRDKYSAAYKNFADHWKAQAMLEAVERLNPYFYPVPLELPKTLDTGIKHCGMIADGFLTKDDFILLYDKSSEILHARNPFTPKAPVVQIGYSVKVWVTRIQRLLALHLIHLVDDDKKWIIEGPNEGPVRLWSAQATDSISSP